MDYAKNNKYFDPELKFGATSYILLIGGILGLLFGLLFFPHLRVVGIIIIICGIIACISAYYNRNIDDSIEDSVIDNAVNSQLVNLQARALKKLDIDESDVREAAPIKFDGYEYRANLVKRGKDKKYRSNVYKAVMLFFSKDEIYCYTYIFSLTEDIQKETTNVYFYKDIVSISTETEGTSVSVGQGTGSEFDYESFKLTTTGGTVLSCSVQNRDDAQLSIKDMRTLIKNKKKETI